MIAIEHRDDCVVSVRLEGGGSERFLILGLDFSNLSIPGSDQGPD